jgi:translation initiation factor 1
MAPPDRTAKDGRGRDKQPPRLDVTTPKPALTHSPFAALAAAPAPPAAASPAAEPPAASPAPAAAPRSSGRLILRRETKHRGGKTVILVAGFAQLPGISDSALTELLQVLKQRLGCGGAVVERELLLQGDRPAQIAALLRERGFRVDGVTQ